MLAIIASWQDVLTTFVNNKYGQTYDKADLDFRHNRFYKELKGRKVIDVFPANDKHIHRGLLNITPYNVSDFFSHNPLIVYPDDDTTGAGLIDLIATSYGIVFDKTIDFDDTFLQTPLRVDSTLRGIEAVIASTSMIWEGKFTIQYKSRGYNLNKEVVNRNLDVLVIPDIVQPNTQSLELITTPLVINDSRLLKLFSGSKPVVIEGDTLDRLMAEIEAQMIVDASDASELRDLFNGVSFVSVEEDNPPFDRYMTTDVALNSGKWSGFPRIKFKSVLVENDIDKLIGTISTGDAEFSVIAPDSFNVLSGSWKRHMLSILTEHARVNPERAQDVNDIITLGVDKVFDNIDYSDVHKTDKPGFCNIYFDTIDGSGYTGRMTVEVPISRYSVEVEEDSDRENPIQTESTDNIFQMENNIVVVETADGEIRDGMDTAYFYQSNKLEDIDLVALMLLDSTDSDTTGIVKLKTGVVSTNKPAMRANDYSHPDWPGVTIRTFLPDNT